MSTLFRQWAVKIGLAISVLASQVAFADMTGPAGVLIGGRSGAKFGLGASVLSQGNTASIPAGTLFDFRLQQSFSG